MTATVEVEKNTSETNAGLIRRFTRGVQESSVLRTARSLRFYVRPLSRQKRQTRALKRLERQKYYERMRKLGKPVAQKRRRR